MFAGCLLLLSRNYWRTHAGWQWTTLYHTHYAYGAAGLMLTKNIYKSTKYQRIEASIHSTHPELSFISSITLNKRCFYAINMIAGLDVKQNARIQNIIDCVLFSSSLRFLLQFDPNWFLQFISIFAKNAK